MLPKGNGFRAFLRLEVATLLIVFGVLDGFVQGACASDLTALSDSTQPFSFAVLGDLHVARPNF